MRNMAEGVAFGGQDVSEGRELGIGGGGPLPRSLSAAGRAAAGMNPIVKALDEQTADSAGFELVLVQVFLGTRTELWSGTG